MKILAIDTTGKTASVAIVDQEYVIAEYTLNDTLTHSQTILPMIDEICKKAHQNIQEIDYIACANGPGSFTGLRIGAATAKGIALALQKEIIPVPTLDALAYNVGEVNNIICPIMDARRSQVYTALYQWENGECTRLTEYMAEPLEEIIELIGERKALFLGDGVRVHRERLQKHSGFSFAPAHAMFQRAASVGLLAIDFAKQGKSISGDRLDLIYLRKSQAEREREERLQAQEASDD